MSVVGKIVLFLFLLVNAVTPLNLFALPSRQFTLLPHQSEAIKAASSTNAARSQIVIPNGGGKTVISYHLAREVLSAQGTVVVFMPTIDLIEEALETFYQDDPQLLDWRKECLCVCSQLSVESVRFTTDCSRIGSFIKGDGPRLVLSTYLSACAISDARLARPFDLALLDESHVAAGSNGETLPSIPLVDEFIACKKRVFMTGSPRVFRSRKMTKGNHVDDQEFSMDNTKVFGEVVYQLSYDEAIERNVTVPVEALACTVPLGQTVNETEWRARVLVDACQRFGLRKVVTFSRSIERTKDLQEALLRTRYFRDVLRVQYNNTSWGSLKKWTKPLGDGESIVICNPYMLKGGFNELKDCDGIYIADRMERHLKLWQVVSRAAMRSEGKEKGYVIFPVQAPDDVDTNQFGNMVPIIRTMLEMDSELLKECRAWLTRDGEAVE